MISILTITLGREKYLSRLLSSLTAFGGDNTPITEHVIVSQGNGHSEESLSKWAQRPKTRIIKYDNVKSVGQVLNEVTPELSGELVFKLDDDAILRSPNFLNSIVNINYLINGAVFSPFPVGLINNLGGPPMIDRKVLFSAEDDNFYTFRRVNHVGGFARIAPRDYLLSTKFSDSHNEDGEFSNYCNSKGVPLYYLENGLIVEHQESTLGQHARYGKEYFKDRF